MKRKITSILLAAGLLVGGYQSQAKAINFVLPPIIPDLCFGSCIQFTQSQLLVQIQQYYAMVQNFRNLGNTIGMTGEAQEANGTVDAAEAANPLRSGVVAAKRVVTDEPGSAARIKRIDAQASGASGTTQHSQALEAYLSTIAGESDKTSSLMAEHEKQQSARDDDAIANMLKEAGPDSASAPGSTL